jgi:uncharacterized protein DUF4157
MSYLVMNHTRKYNNKMERIRTPIPSKSSSNRQLTSNNNNNTTSLVANLHNPSVMLLHKAIGNQALQRLANLDNGTGSGFMEAQPKLKISQPGDTFEQEADKVAEQVMNGGGSGNKRMLRPSHSSSNHEIITQMVGTKNEETSNVDDKCQDCKNKKEKEENETMNFNRKPSSYGNHASVVASTSQNRNMVGSTNDISNVILGGSGSTLDTSTRKFMEFRFGHNFSNVRIHTNDKAARSARSINALAYTVGNDIVFGEGQYQPHTYAGQKLLAHELTHVIQQQQEQSDVANKHDVSTALAISKMSSAEMTIISRREDPRVNLAQELEGQFRQAISASNWNYAVDRLAAIANIADMPRLLVRYVMTLVALQNLKNAAIRKFGLENRIVAAIDSVIESKFHIPKVAEVKK